MADSDPVKGSKVAKPRAAAPVPVVGDHAAASELSKPADGGEPKETVDDENFDPPTEKHELTKAEKADAASELPEVQPPPAPAVPPTYEVTAGGRAWYRGQQIKFQTGEIFTSETWDELAIEGFRECGVTIKRIK